MIIRRSPPHLIPLRRLGRLGFLSTLGILGSVVVGCSGPDDSAPTCADDERLEDGVCVPPDCGEGTWGDLERDGATVHVRFGGEGDGSEEAPFGSIADAVDAAVAAGGGLVAVGAGVFEGLVRLDAGDPPVTIAGRCRRGTELAAADGDDEWTVRTEAEGTVLRSLTVRGGRGVRVAGENGPADLLVEDVEVVGSSRFGVSVRDAGAAAAVRDSVVRGGAGGGGLHVERGAALTAERVTISGTNDWGVLAEETDQSILLEDVEVRDTVTTDDGIGGGGVAVFGVDELTAVGLVVDGAHANGIHLRRSTVTIEGGAVRNVLIGDLDEGFEEVRAVRVVDGANLTASDWVVESNEAYGVHSQGAGVVVLSDLRVSDHGLTAITAINSVDVTVTDALIERPRIGVSRDNAPLRLERVEVVDARAVAVELTGSAASVTVLDSTIRGAGGGGLLLSGAAVVAVDGLVVQDIAGVGIWVIEGARLTASDLTVERAADRGIYVSGVDSEGLFTDTLIRDMNQSEVGVAGRGLTAARDARIEGTRVTVENVHDLGVLAHERAYVDLTDSVIRGVRDVHDVTSGIGFVSQISSEAWMRDSLIEDTDGPGVVSVFASFNGVGVDVVDTHFAAYVADSATVSLNGGLVKDVRSHASKGGGVGVYGWRRPGRVTQVAARNMTFEDFRGPAMYVVETDDPNYSGYVLRGCTVRRTGGFPLPGGVFATRGTTAWTDAGGGLMVEGNTFEDIGYDAILLDRAAGTLRSLGPDANTFTNIGGEPLFVQRCDAGEAEVLDASADPTCRAEPRIVGPVLEYDLHLAESTPIGR